MCITGSSARWGTRFFINGWEGLLERGGWRQEAQVSSWRTSEGGAAGTESVGRTELAEEELGSVCSQQETVLMPAVCAHQ